jgi:hypothetical protein
LVVSQDLTLLPQVQQGLAQPGLRAPHPVPHAGRAGAPARYRALHGRGEPRTTAIVTHEAIVSPAGVSILAAPQRG